jgi:hypothetical protein
LVGLLTVLGAMAGLALAAPAHARSSGDLRTIASGLDDPRGVVVLPSGRLVVAEAGHAGDLCLAPGVCLGLTGRVTEISKRHKRALATGLPSLGGRSRRSGSAA